jgi:hypothetical protein
LKIIEIIVDTKGNSQVQTKGFAGSECLKASQFVEQALGQQTSQRTTPEFFQTQVQSAELQLVPKANQN